MSPPPVTPQGYSAPSGAQPGGQSLAEALASLHDQTKTLRTPIALASDLLAEALLQRRYGPSSVNPSPSMGEGQGWGGIHAASGAARERNPLGLSAGSQGASPVDDLPGRGLTPIPNPSPIEGEGLPPSPSPGAPAPSAPGGTASAAPAAASPAAGAAGAPRSGPPKGLPKGLQATSPTLADALKAWFAAPRRREDAPTPAPGSR